MIVGFTGTQQGMTFGQKAQLREWLNKLKASEFHHGDCIGADAEAHDEALCVGVKVIIHPPLLSKKRAFRSSDTILPPLPYMERNMAIVHACEVLIAGPLSNNETTRSGTWATVRAARRLGKAVIILPR